MFTEHQLSTRPRTELKYQADHKTRRKYYKNEYVFWEICSNGHFMGKLGTTIQILCATKLEISVYVWNEIIQEVIELFIWRTFLIWGILHWIRFVLTILQDWSRPDERTQMPPNSQASLPFSSGLV